MEQKEAKEIMKNVEIARKRAMIISEYLCTVDKNISLSKEQILLSSHLSSNSEFPRIKFINKELKKYGLVLEPADNNLLRVSKRTIVKGNNYKEENITIPLPPKPVWEGTKEGNNAAGEFLAKNVFSYDMKARSKTIIEICLRHNDFVYDSFDSVINITKKILRSDFNIELTYQDPFYTPVKLGNVVISESEHGASFMINGEEQDFSKFILHVYDSLSGLKCSNGEVHSVENVTIQTINIHRRVIRFNAFYCKKCKIYFTNIEAVKHDFEGLDYPFVKMNFHCFNSFGLKEESKLKMYGYNVQKGVLEDYERKNLLSAAMDYGVLNKHEIMSVIGYCIRTHEGQESYNEAVKKWKDDYGYVQDYKINNQRHIFTENVITKYKK